MNESRPVIDVAKVDNAVLQSSSNPVANGTIMIDLWCEARWNRRSSVACCGRTPSPRMAVAANSNAL
jgi:hypothetical protein